MMEKSTNDYEEEDRIQEQIDDIAERLSSVIRQKAAEHAQPEH